MSDLPFKVKTANQHSGFVGLVAQKDGVLPILQLPIGYPEPKSDDSRWEAYWLIFSVCRVFVDQEEKLKLAKPNENGVVRQKDGSGQSDSTVDQYGEISWERNRIFKALVQRMRQPEVLMTEVRKAMRDGFDARHLHRMWSHAMYCNDVPVFDTHLGRRTEMQVNETHGNLGVAAWLVVDYLKNIEQDAKLDSLGNAAATVQMLAQEFSSVQGLAHPATLWAVVADSMKTRSALNMAFADLLKRNPLRTPQAQDLVELIDRALNTHTALNKGELWGMKGFADVWEAMCLSWALDQDKSGIARNDVFTLDEKHLHVRASEKNKWSGNQASTFHLNNKNRRPDLVISHSKTDGRDPDRIKVIVDFKYYSSADLEDIFSRERAKLNSNETDEKKGSIQAYKVEIKKVCSSTPVQALNQYEALVKALEKVARRTDVVDSLEAYRLLAAVCEPHQSPTNPNVTAESIPIEIWAPGQPDVDCTKTEKVLPNLTIRTLPVNELMKCYLNAYSGERDR